MLFGKAWFSKFMVFFGYLMALIYIGLGVLLFTTHIFPVKPPALNFSFALFLIAYGGFRFVKLIVKNNFKNN